ncbi:hypothetical protein [Deinococcus puniceus]|uniref:Uncharacterized protein n=1 Tax=Deinococcus puniceus TaxID=1182568 RepID=A0A172TB13_9DEIO|nr:hypothetical protein [Deinococcus puniceus]ANE44200.1 hypothetical protein SU48_10950 [Deinococcus puniceus]
MTFRYAVADKYPNYFSITNDDKGLVADIIGYVLGETVSGRTTFAEIEACFAPKGEGYYVQDVVGCHWIDDIEYSIYGGYREMGARYGKHVYEGVALDYPNLDLWRIDRDRPRAMMEIEGEELRRLFREVHAIYLEKGLYDPPKKKRGWFGF